MSLRRINLSILGSIRKSVHFEPEIAQKWKICYSYVDGKNLFLVAASHSYSRVSLLVNCDNLDNYCRFRPFVYPQKPLNFCRLNPGRSTQDYPGPGRNPGQSWTGHGPAAETDPGLKENWVLTMYNNHNIVTIL